MNYYGTGALTYRTSLLSSQTPSGSIVQNGARLLRLRTPITSSIGGNHISPCLWRSIPSCPTRPWRHLTRLFGNGTDALTEDGWAELITVKKALQQRAPRMHLVQSSVASCRRTPSWPTGIQIEGGKLTVFGNSNWVTNAWFNRRGNRELFSITRSLESRLLYAT